MSITLWAVRPGQREENDAAPLQIQISDKQERALCNKVLII